MQLISNRSSLRDAQPHVLDTQHRDLDSQLYDLVSIACQYPVGHLRRQRALTQIVRLVARSHKLWCENTPDYEDALQQTWLYFCQNICEAGSGEQYDPARSSVITWLNRYLKWRLQDLRAARQQRQRRFLFDSIHTASTMSDSMADLAAPPEVPPILEETRGWVQSDPTGVLSSTHLRHRTDVTCQHLILRRLPPETSWEALSMELGVAVSTLSSFYQRQCLPHLRKFGERQGYL